MDENQEYTIEEVDNLISINKETMKELERTRNRCHYARDEISVSKGVIRITENIRKLLRIRMKLIKEDKDNKINKGGTSDAR